MGTKKILFLICGLVMLILKSESKKAVKGHCGAKGRKDRWRGCKKRDGSKENPTANPTNTPTVEPTNDPTQLTTSSPTAKILAVLVNDVCCDINDMPQAYPTQPVCQSDKVGQVCDNQGKDNEAVCVNLMPHQNIVLCLVACKVETEKSNCQNDIL